MLKKVSTRSDPRSITDVLERRLFSLQHSVSSRLIPLTSSRMRELASSPAMALFGSRSCSSTSQRFVSPMDKKALLLSLRMKSCQSRNHSTCAPFSSLAKPFAVECSCFSVFLSSSSIPLFCLAHTRSNSVESHVICVSWRKKQISPPQPLDTREHEE